MEQQFFGDSCLLPAQCLEDLRAGNIRFHKERMIHPNRDAQRRFETVRDGQSPKAVVLTCSDSRIPVEIVFDQGIGDLFVVRVAGNGLGEGTLGSIEYGVRCLNAPLVVIMGHTCCGAVDAVCSDTTIDGHLQATLGSLIKLVNKKRELAPITSPLTFTEQVKDQITIDHIKQSVKTLSQKVPVIRQGIEQQSLMVVGCLYHTAEGFVDWLD